MLQHMAVPSLKKKTVERLAGLRILASWPFVGTSVNCDAFAQVFVIEHQIGLPPAPPCIRIRGFGFGV